VSEFKKDYHRYFWAPFTQMGDLSEDEPLVIVSGEGATVTNELGETFIDGHGGLWLVNAGFGRKEIMDAAAEQMYKLSWFPSFEGMCNDAALALARRLVNMTIPEGMARVFFSSGGSEANEAALKMARQYWRLQGHPGRYKVISRSRAYHGVSMGALSATGIAENRRHFEPLVPGFRHIQPPYCYRCPYGLQREDCELNCARELETAIRFEGPDTVAAFIGEPVMGAGGVLVPPDGYWQEIQRICKKYDVLLIADEVITGFGRTGEMFGVRHWDVEPDIMTFAKALTSGYHPLGATLVREDIFSVMLGEYGEDREFQHGTTYAGHPVACAAAQANLDIIEDEELARQARDRGEYLLSKLEELQDLPVVGDLDGLGLMARLEIVRDADDGTPFSPQEQVGLRVARELQKRGIILRPIGDIITFSPPLVIEESQIEEMVTVLGQILEDLT